MALVSKYRFLSGAVKLCFLFVALLSLAACSGRATPVEKSDEAFDDIRAEVSSVISETDRAAEIISLIDEMQQAFADAREIRQGHLSDFVDLNRNYNTTQAQFDELISATAADIEAGQELVIVINRKLVSKMTAEEWQDLNKLRGRAFDRLVKAMDEV